eukprot:RCo050974
MRPSGIRLSSVISFYDKTVERYASKKPRTLKVRDAVEFCTQNGGKITEKQLITSARYLQRELPVRLALSLRDFQNLPYIVGVNPHINKVYQTFWETFVELTTLWEKPLTTLQEEKEYTECIARVLRKNQNAISEVSPGIAEVRMLPNSTRIDFAYLDRFLTGFITDRLARRTLASFHQALHNSYWSNTHDPDWVGCFNKRLSAAKLCESCFQVVAQIGRQIYGRAPKLKVLGDIDSTFTSVPILMENVLYEIFKNSLRAVHEHHQAQGCPADGALPDVVVKICAGTEMTIIVSDRGGGIPTPIQDAVWSFGFSTHQPESFDVSEYRVNFRSGQETDERLQFAGLGFGLPMSRTFVRYLGGEVLAHSLAGYGCDVYIHCADPMLGYIARGG